MLGRMWKPQLGRRARLLVCLSTVSALALGGGIAWAAVPDSSGVITGCYEAGGQGDLRIIDAADSCKRNEIRLTWNQQGQPGAQGLAGATGAAGPAGPAGPQGEGAAGPRGRGRDPSGAGTCRQRSGDRSGTPAGVGRPGRHATCQRASFTISTGPTGAVSGLHRRPHAGGSMRRLPEALGHRREPGWSGACTGMGACTVAMNDVRTVTATFHAAMTLRVEVRNTAGQTFAVYGTNRVTGPDEFGAPSRARGPTTCSTTVPVGVPVTFTAVPDPDDSLDRWSGVCSASTPQCTFTPQPGPTPLIATFLERLSGHAP